LGHRRIGYISGASNLTLSAYRFSGFKRALAEAGVNLIPDAVVRGDFQYAGGEAAMRELLRRNLRLTAVFANNDRMALGAFAVLHRAGLRVPEDVSVIGFDDIPQATETYPALSTVAQPIIEMAQISVSLLIERLKNTNDKPPQRIVLPTSLIKRESCYPLLGNKRRPNRGVLHVQLSQLLASMQRTDSLVISEAVLPVPPGVPCIDLAVSAGVPALLDVARSVATELKGERLVVPAEMKQHWEFLPGALQACFPDARFETVSNDELIDLASKARVMVRTGESTPFADVIVYGGGFARL
ncbi:MAG TPA: substrate-binding domain-containing protein, partial [Aggregatilineaceae bacterium]|nr:substrate-binding domain-containing protein [Aggregatilineaceae bacterium]